MKVYRTLTITIFLLAGLSLQAQSGMHNITVQQADSLIKARADNPDFVILDIRTPAEFDNGHIENSEMLNIFSKKGKRAIFKLDKEKSYLIYCRSGVRSGNLLKKMKNRDFNEVYNMLGGIKAWTKEGYKLIEEEKKDEKVEK